jgi:hypothetical protein
MFGCNCKGKVEELEARLKELEASVARKQEKEIYLVDPPPVDNLFWSFVGLPRSTRDLVPIEDLLHRILDHLKLKPKITPPSETPKKLELVKVTKK